MTRGSVSSRPAPILLLAAAISLRSAAASAQESWDVIYLAGTKIGHVHTYIEKVPRTRVASTCACGSTWNNGSSGAGISR